MNLAAALEARSLERGFADRPALVAGQRVLSHRDVHDGAARVASLLASLGVRRGHTVLLALPDGLELAWAFLAAVRLGALAVPVNPQLPSSDHRHLALDCEAAVVVCADDLVDRFASVAGEVVPAIAIGGAVDRHPRHPPAPVDGSEAAYAQYTSGTTGAPRAAVHRHADPFVYAAAFAGPGLALGPSDVILSVSKMFFAYGLGNSLFFPLLAGASAVLHPGRPRPEEIVALLERHRVSVLFAVPTFYANLLRLASGAGGGGTDSPSGAFASLRVAVSAGERLLPILAERAQQLLGAPVLDSLGTTEVGQAFVSATLDGAPAGTLGRALPPYEISIRGDDGTERPPGSVGTLWVRGPTVLKAYLGQPQATAAALDGEWLRTGDLASVDASGFVSHHGRADDMEMVGGITVAPQEIEDLISRHPAVSEVAVASVADADGGAQLQAFVVVVPGCAGDEGLRIELLGLARAQLAHFKVPRSVTFVDGLPRTATGKLRRFVLRSGTTWPAPSLAG